MIQILIGFIVPIIVYMIIWYLVKKENERVWSPSEIIDYIARYYTLRTRSTDGYKCKYNNAGGKHCAFGLVVINPYSLIEDYNADHYLGYNDNILKPQFKVFTLKYELIEFYLAIQKLHDESNNWNEFGLSEYGKQEVKRLKELYK